MSTLHSAVGIAGLTWLLALAILVGVEMTRHGISVSGLFSEKLGPSRGRPSAERVLLFAITVAICAWYVLQTIIAGSHTTLQAFSPVAVAAFALGCAAFLSGKAIRARRYPRPSRR
jgi:hypothetical protein